MEQEMTKASLIISGQARLPKDLFPQAVFEVVIEVDRDSGDILDASVGPCLPVVTNFLNRLIIGTNFKAGVKDLLEAINLRIHSRNKKAILAAIRDAIRNYEDPTKTAQGECQAQSNRL